MRAVGSLEQVLNNLLIAHFCGSRLCNLRHSGIVAATSTAKKNNFIETDDIK